MMTLTPPEEAINQTHRELFDQAAAKYGGMFRIPQEVINEICETTRKMWVGYVEAREKTVPTDPAKAAKASETMREFCQGQVGLLVTPHDLAKAADCTVDTARRFILNNRSMFRKVARGTHMVLDPDAERAAAKRPASVPSVPAVATGMPSAVSTARDDAAAATVAVDAMAGGRITRPRGLPGKD